MKQKLFFLATLFSSVFMASCSDDDAPAKKSAEKEIISFKLAGFTPEVVGDIDNDGNQIELVVPNGTDVTALVPTIEVSPKATVSPVSGVAVDFTNSVFFLVKAEDGSGSTYSVNVVVSTEVDFSVTPLEVTELQQDNIIIIDGANFGSDYTLNKVVLINKSTNAEITLAAYASSTSTRLFVKVPADAVLGTYDFVVYKGNQNLKLSPQFTIVPHTPVIESMDKSEAVQGTNVTITGKYFMATSNQVRLNSGGNATSVEVIEQSTTAITFKVPPAQAVGSYTVSVISNSKESFYNAAQLKVVAPATTPTITNIDKVSYKRGETITITGTNLKKIGVASNINFVPFMGGTTQVRSGIANTEGTQVTYVIPSDFPVGTYVISVEVDFEYSNDYNEVIQITAN